MGLLFNQRINHLMHYCVDSWGRVGTSLTIEMSFVPDRAGIKIQSFHFSLSVLLFSPLHKYGRNLREK